MHWNTNYIKQRCNQLYVNQHFSNYDTTLYHYTSKNSGENIIKSKELWLTKYNLSNDNQEFKHGLQIIKTQLKEIIDKDEKTKVIFEKLIPFLEEESKSPKTHFYMICFCSTSRNEYLKRNYANGKKGLCLNIKLASEDFNNQKPILYKTIYSINKFKRILTKLLYNYRNMIISHFEEWSKLQIYDQVNSEFFVLLIRDLFIHASRLKRHKFSAEKEIRLLAWGDMQDEKYIMKFEHTLIKKA